MEPYSGSGNQLSRNRRGPPHGVLQKWRDAREHYVGLDVSLKLTAICIIDRTGKIEREGVVASDPEAIATFIKLHAPMRPDWARDGINVDVAVDRAE